MSEGARGVVVAHGRLAHAMVDAVRGIAGEAAEALVPVSNEGAGPAELRERLESALGEHPGVVFVDLRSGSCGMAAFQSCRERGDRAVVCGVNLPMLLDFVFHVELPLDELVERVVRQGKDSVSRPTLAR